MDTYVLALGPCSCPLVGSNSLQLAKEHVIARFIYHAPLDLEFDIITCVLPFPLQPPFYSFLFHYKNTITAG